MPLTVATAGLIGSLGAAGLNLGSQLMTNIFNKRQQDEANEIVKQNNQWQQQFATDERDWNREQYLDEQKYNRELQQTMFEREDNAYQRTKDDLVAAGYSPLAINGTNDAGSIVGNSSHDTSASIPELSAINPFQAKNLDFGQFADILGQADAREVARERNRIEEEKYLSDAEQKKLDRKQKQEQFYAKLDSDQKNFDTQIEVLKNQHKLTNERENKKLDQKDKEIELLINQAKLEESKVRDKAVQEAVFNLTGFHGCAKYVPDSEVEPMLQQWQEVLSQALEDRNNYLKEHASSLSHGYSNQTGAKAGGYGIDIGADYGKSEQGSEAYEVWRTADGIVEKALVDAAKRGIYYPLKEYK